MTPHSNRRICRRIHTPHGCKRPYHSRYRCGCSIQAALRTDPHRYSQKLPSLTSSSIRTAGNHRRMRCLRTGRRYYTNRSRNPRRTRRNGSPYRRSDTSHRRLLNQRVRVFHTRCSASCRFYSTLCSSYCRIPPRNPRRDRPFRSIPSNQSSACPRRRRMRCTFCTFRNICQVNDISIYRSARTLMCDPSSANPR